MTVLKSIVLCLALANVGYFLWTQEIAKPRAIPAPAASLKLASEASTAPAADSSTQATGGATSSALTGNGQSGAPAGAITASSDRGLPTDPSSAAGTGLLGSAKRCITVGPFHDVSEAVRAASTLRGSGYDPRQRVVDGEVWAGVWVFLPIPPTRGAGDQLLAKLKGAGIEDALEMPGPADVSVVSLGLFSDQKRAQTRIAQARTLGLNPTIADRKRTGNVYWIDFDLKSSNETFNPAELQGQAGHIQRLEVKVCPAPLAQP